MTSIGDRLRQERLRRGLDIYQLAEKTKINASMLEAIEADDLEKLPGRFFARSFVRQYAKALGLDDDDLESELWRLTSTGEPPAAGGAQFAPENSVFLPPAAEPASGGSSRQSLGALIAFVLVMAIASLIYTFWQRSRTADRPETAPAAEARKQPEPASRSASTGSVAPAAAPQLPASQSDTAQPGTASETPLSQPPSQNQATTAAPEAASPVPAGEAAAIRVQVHAARTAWIKVVADGTTLYSGTLQPNQSRSFDGKAQMNLRIGDSRAAEITWNGKPVGEIGPSGQPRTVRFTQEGFKVLTPAPPEQGSRDEP
jgi:cytoskeleton protein RodZ